MYDIKCNMTIIIIDTILFYLENKIAHNYYIAMCGRREKRE